jgi:glycosyltransferase involved in cell wall biosynthesis
VKHIVFVIGNYKNGGVAMRSTNLANAFAEKGYKATILVTGAISDEVYFKHHENVEIAELSKYIEAHKEDKTLLEYRNKQQETIGKLKRLRHLTRFFPELDKVIAEKIRGIRRSKDMSAFVLNNQESIYIAFGLGYYEKTFFSVKPFGSKIIYAERNASEVEFPKEIDKRKRLIELVEKADGVVLQTENELEFYGNKLKNAAVINNPVKSSLPQRFKGERRKVIVNFCRVSKQKNLPLLFDAMQKLHKDYPEYILEIYGNTVVEQEEELLKEYKQLLKDMDAEAYIKLLPPSKDVHNIIRDSAMFVSSSDFEGLSNSMIEAMAIGLPCVCTDCLGGGAREMITDGENGLLVPMNDPEALYLAMKRFIEEPDLAEKCSINAEKKRDELSLPVIAGKWLDYIESII